MTNLFVSSTQITFQPNQSIKTIQLINRSQQQPIMYKIKTNKIDYVDAKPSCGYISGKPGQNEISVIIRSLNNKKQYTAKLQILYIAHQRITQQVVQRNKKHFDINQYNEIYETIKSVSKNDAKVELINVTKKIEDTSQDAPVDQRVEMVRKKVTVQKLEEKLVVTKKEKEKGTIQIEKGRLLNILLVVLLIGLWVGFSLGCKYGHVLGWGKNERNASEVKQVSQSQERVGENTAQVVNQPQTVTQQPSDNNKIDQTDFKQTDESATKQDDAQETVDETTFQQDHQQVSNNEQQEQEQEQEQEEQQEQEQEEQQEEQQEQDQRQQRQDQELHIEQTL